MNVHPTMKPKAMQRPGKQAGLFAGSEPVMKLLADYKPNDWNVNSMTPDERKAFRLVLQEHGWLRSQAMLVWATDEKGKPKNLIIDGEHRWKEATALGFTHGPVVEMHGLTRREAIAWTIRVDKIRGRFDDHKTAVLLDNEFGLFAGREETIDVAIRLGFSPGELDDLRGKLPEVAGAGARGLEDGEPVVEDDVPIDRAAELREKWGTAPGQLWTIGPHRLMVGSSTVKRNVDRLMDGQHARFMWTDPPYGVDYVGGFHALPEKGRRGNGKLQITGDGPEENAKLLREAFALAHETLADGSAIYCAYPEGVRSIGFVHAFIDAGWRHHETLIWLKHRFVLGHSDYHYMHEPILYGWKGKNRQWFGGRDKTSILAYPSPHKSDTHPTMKPVGLVAHCIANSSKKGQIGYEPFGGSGTSWVACEQLGRRCFGFEIEPKYAAVTLERLAAMELKPKLESTVKL